MSIQLRLVFFVCLFLTLATTGFAAERKKPRKPKTKTTARAYQPRLLYDPQMQRVSNEGYPLSASFDRTPIAIAPRSATPAAPSLSALMPSDPAPSRIVNFRLHPIYFVNMIAQKDTLAAGRVDIDFIVSDRFTLGPSLIYNRTSHVDNASLAAGGAWQTVEVERFDLGLLSNIYLLGTAREGGLSFRPHAYYLAVSGEKQDDKDTTIVTGTSANGWRAGAELVYQKMLPMGLNFEVGGGFTYHLSPYDVTYSDGNGAKSSGPEHTVEPTISLGIGWAF